MNQIPFEEIIERSPVLTPAIKEAILQSADILNEEKKQEIVKKLLKYESDVLAGAQELLSYLGNGSEV